MQNQQQLNSAKWVQDKEAKKCKACKNSFNTLFRRKHHCRNCGEVFCDSCSNFFLDRKHFKESERIKKNKVRLCEACYKKINDNLRLNGEQNLQYKLEDQQSQIRRHSKSFNVNDNQPDSVSQASTHISSLLETKSNSLKNENSTIMPYSIIIQEDELTKKQKKLEQNMNDIIFQYLSLGIRKLGISENWTNTLNSFLKQMMIDLRDLSVNPERIRCVETIMQQISIKIIPFISYHATRYIRGVIIRKNVAHRKMQTIFKNAKILLLWDSLDPNINNFETLVKNEKKFIQQALEQIEKLAPNVILIEKSINNVILNELQKRNITVSIQCKVEHLNKIAETTQAKIIKSYDIFKQNCEQDCLGKCDKIVYASFDGESIRQNAQVFESLNESNKKSLESYLENQKKDSTFLFISEPNSNRYTLSISGPKIDELKNIKECFKQQIPLAYEVLLEYQMIYQDLKLKRDLAQLYKQSEMGVQMLTCGEISDFGTFQQNNNDLQNSEGILLQKVIYHKGVRSKIYDVHKKKNSECLEQYIQNNQQNFNGKIISFYCQMCDKTEEKKCFLDSTENKKNDTSLGKYIADKANYDEQKCSKCGTRRIEHISIRYGPGAFFKCVVEKKKTDQLQLNNPTDNLPSRSQTDFNSIEQQEESQTQQEIQNIEQTQNQKVFQYNITNYLKCKLCNKQLTKSYQLGQHLEYSFFRMVQHSIKNSIKYKRKLNTNWLQFYGELENLESLNQCCHQEIERIYECGDNLVKIYTNVFETFNLKTFQFNTDEVKHHIQNFDKDEVAKRCDEILQILQKFQQFLSSLNDLQITKSQKSSMTSSTQLPIQSQPLFSFQDIKQLNQYNEEIQKIYEKMKSYQYDQFIQFELDSMQLFSICSKIYTPIFEKFPDRFKSSSMLKSTQQRQQTINLDKDFAPKPSFFYRKTIKENTQIPISQSQPITNEYPTAQFSPQQFPYSPESQVQDMDDSGESTIGKINIENEPNFAFLRNIISSWPRSALNLDLQSVQQQFFNYLPIYSQGEVDLIASAFNDSKYYIMHQQFQMENLWNKFQDYSNQKQQNENSDFQIEATQILKEGPKQSKDVKEIIIKIQKNQQIQQKQSSNNLQEDDSSNIDEDQQSMAGYSQTIQTSESPRKPTNKVQIQIFYPKQFECLRIMNGIHITQFIKSILSCTNWNSAGGKSGSSFYKSADNLFIFKAIKQQEFETFEIFAPKYFVHMYRVFFQKAQCKSVLNKIYGMFTIKNNKGVQYFVAMENLFFGMAPDLLVYDLKGSEANRWNRKNQKTLLDTNYIIDRNGEPLPISEKDYDYIESALDFDSQFLLDVKVVDYSLLLIIDKMNHIIKLSIIDYLQDFDIKKKVENKLKLAINLGTDPTIVNPAEYYERFIKAMQRYFMKIYQSL